MAKRGQQKLKLLYLLRILQERTDEEHPMPMAELIAALADAGIEAERKSLYDDLEALRVFGADVQLDRRAGGGYFLGERPMELAELKLLVDAVQCSRFITEKKSARLIDKLSRLTSIYRAGQLRRQVYVAGRNKSRNEAVYYAVDAIYTAIATGVQIRFRYGEYSLEKKLVPRHDGRMYQVSPWALSFSDDNYYLVSYDADAAGIRHFRVDKMMGVKLTDVARTGDEAFAGLEPGQYAKRTFFMYGGEVSRVTLIADNHLAGAMLDRFGMDLALQPLAGQDRFRIEPEVAVSPNFFAWLVGFGDQVTLAGPAEVRAAFVTHLRRTAAQYLTEGNT